MIINDAEVHPDNYYCSCNIFSFQHPSSLPDSSPLHTSPTPPQKRTILLYINPLALLISKHSSATKLVIFAEPPPHPHQYVGTLILLSTSKVK